MRPRFLLALCVGLVVLGCGDGRGRSGKRPVGDPCESPADCEFGCILPSDVFPGGLCTRWCGEDWSCPPGSQCLDFGGGIYCYRLCSTSDECREAWGCGSAGACVPCALEPSACETPPQPDAGTEDAPEEAGRPDDAEADVENALDDGGGPNDVDADAEVPLLPNGRPCAQANQCRSQLCLPPELGGVCADRCSPSERCRYGYSCVPFAEDSDGNGRTDRVGYGCYDYTPSQLRDGEPCTSAAQCRSRLCEDGICTRICGSAADCVPLTSCVAESLPLDEGSGTRQLCRFPTPGIGEVRRVSLGTQEMFTGQTGEMGEVWVPPTAVSLHLFGQQRGARGAILGVLDAFDPANEQILSLVDFVEGRDTPNWQMPTGRATSFFVPISDRVTFRPGRYRWIPMMMPPDQTSSFSDIVEWTAHVKLDPGGAVAGRLAANLFFVGCVVNATSAPTSTRFQAALDEWERIFASVAIEVGDYTYIDITGAAATRYSTLDVSEDDIDGGEVGPLLALSAGRTEVAVNIFFVHDIEGYGAAGFATSIPGPPAIHGTTHSGVVVNLDSIWDFGAAFLGKVIAHEVAHYLGLWHSTERPDHPLGYEHDPLNDTPTGDRNNLMHWSATSGAYLSPAQGMVMRRSPTVRFP